MNHKHIAQAVRVSHFLMELCEKYPDRWEAAEKAAEKNGSPPYPFADLAYGEALMAWYKDGCPKPAWYSTAPGQVEDVFLLEFREEIGKEFGLPIMTCENGEMERRKHKRIITTNVTDWGLN